MALMATLRRTCCLLTSRLSVLPLAAAQTHISVSCDVVPLTSLSRPPWRETRLVPEEEERRQHAVLTSAVNRRIEEADFGRLFAVVHFASRQWKVTDEDLILVENHVEAVCGERLRLEKVLLVGARDFTLVGRPLLAKELVRVDATVLEKTESWPKVHMQFWRRHRFQRKKIIVQPQTVLRINRIQLAPALT
ncbi:39S ribosomal protein L21, mitochondrial [Phycodurus eques]|uniref:39S ribosomal protein L21, mitochondrial n=1 Tax=Phycodurus eques TaxID=693459 RepID=UPI002ACF076E|nr:39S ribosomal protein L21, mitochondrial [Phycodurus eques]XP_061536243.1 39S ribosomal protein L21, mitochondrial [Phycodurus eques]